MTDRELDALVHTEIMDYHGAYRYEGAFGHERTRLVSEDCPHYSTDIAAAYLMEERIIELELEPQYSEALLDLTDASEHFEMIHASPRDRCRAALKAVEVEND